MSAIDSPAEETIAIAGAGVIGMSLAWRLAQAGRRVTVFDKGRVGGEASWASAGMLALGGEIEGSSRLAALAVESRHLYRDFVRELERASDSAIDYQECGGLDLAYSPAEFEALEQRATAQAHIRIPSKAVAPQEVATFWPWVRSQGLAGARFYPSDGLVNPRDMMDALEAACRRAGVAVVPNCAVRSIEISDRVARVASARGEEEYGVVIVAAGAWSGGIGVSGVPPLPESEPVKGHLIGYVQPVQTCNTIVRHGNTYFLQRANGLMIVGASVEHVGFDRTVEPLIAAELAAEAGAVFPHLRETTPSEVWTGFRPGPDALHMGEWHSRRLYLAYGHYRNGILLAPVTAQRMAAEISAS